MSNSIRKPLVGCSACTADVPLAFEFTMAFQPIINTTSRQIFAHEALCRGMKNESAGSILSQVNDTNRYRFDQTCRVKAIQLAAELKMSTYLSINFMPNAVYRPENCIRTTLAAAEKHSFPINRIIFEVTEGERVNDPAHLREIMQHYKQRGFLTAIDDFGAGHSGLNLLADLPIDLIKLDMALVRNIDQDRGRRAIVKGVVQVCEELSTRVIAEGVETYEELTTLQSFGIELFQGYYFAKPAFRALAPIATERY